MYILLKNKDLHVKIQLYAIHDAKLKAFSPPFPAQNADFATRAFTQQCQDQNNPMSQYPFDYSLFHIGTYDEDTGITTTVAPPEHLITANNALDNAREEQVRQKTQVSRRLQVELEKIVELNTKIEEEIAYAEKSIDKLLQAKDTLEGIVLPITYREAVEILQEEEYVDEQVEYDS